MWHSLTRLGIYHHSLLICVCLFVFPPLTQNNATCVDLNEAYSCECLPGWEGSLCEVETDECEPNQCQNDAVCVDKFLDYE